MNKYLEKIASTRLGREALKHLSSSVRGELPVVREFFPNRSAVAKATLLDRAKHFARSTQPGAYGREFLERHTSI